MCKAIGRLRLIIKAFIINSLDIDEKSRRYILSDSKVLAKVMGKPITEDDVTRMISGMGQRGASYQNPQGHETILGQLVNQQLILLDAIKTGLDKSDEYQAELKRVKEEILTSYAISTLMKDINISDEDIKSFYKKNTDRFQSQALVNASHILFDEEEMGNDIMKELDAGDITFEEGAEKYSKCPSNGSGGSLGDFSRGKMVQEFEDVCFNMTEGEVKGPIKTPFGWHIIKLNKILEPTSQSFDDVKEDLKRQLMGEKQNAAYSGKVNVLRAEYPVEILSK